MPPVSGARSWPWLPTALVPGPRRPPVEIELGPTVPAWVLRVACVAAAAVCVALVASHPVHWLLAAGLVTVMVLRPDTGAGAAFAVGIGALLATDDIGSFDVRVPLLVLGLHLGLELMTLTADLPWRTTVERSALRAHLAPMLPIQAISQPVALVGPWLATTRPDAPWVPALAGLALAALAWITASRLRTRS